MRFRDTDGRLVKELPTELPFAVVVEDMEGAVAHMYVITRETVYRFDPQTFVSLMKRYSEASVKNDTDNAPTLEKVRNATQALRGIVGRN